MSQIPNNYKRNSRRRILTALGSAPLVGLLPAARAQQRPMSISKLNCFELRVSDPGRTVAFYQDMFGMPVQARVGNRICLRVGTGPQFMQIRPLQPGEIPAITWLGYSVENFDLADQQAALQAHGFRVIDAPLESTPGIENTMSTWVRMRGNTPELFFADARGLIVHLGDTSYCGGSGPLGNQCAAPEPAQAGMFNLADINHFTVFVNDGAEANRFYQQTFDLEVQAYQGPNAPVTGIGDGYQFVMYAGGNPDIQVPANIHHGSLNINDFDVDEIIGKLNAYGMTEQGDRELGPMMHYISLRQPARGGAPGGTPEFYFTDPDGIRMQLQDITYCGGGGYLGNECLAG